MKGDGRIVAGAEQQSIQQCLQCQLLPHLQIHGGALCIRRLPGDRDHIVQVSLPDSHQGRQNLGTKPPAL